MNMVYFVVCPFDIRFQVNPIVRLADPTNNESKMKLAEIYEIINEPRKALDLVYEGVYLSIFF